MGQVVVAVCVLVAATALAACAGSTPPDSDGADNAPPATTQTDGVDNPPAVTTQAVDPAQTDIEIIRDSVLNGYCDPESGTCYDSYAEQAGVGVTVKDFSCVSVGGRQYECIVQGSDGYGEFNASVTGSCDDTGCIWRSQ